MKNSVEIKEINVSIKSLMLGKKDFTRSIFNQLAPNPIPKNYKLSDNEQILGYVRLQSMDRNCFNQHYWILTVLDGKLNRYFVPTHIPTGDGLNYNENTDFNKIYEYEQIFILK